MLATAAAVAFGLVFAAAAAAAMTCRIEAGYEAYIGPICRNVRHPTPQFKIHGSKSGLIIRQNCGLFAPAPVNFCFGFSAPGQKNL